MIDVFLSEKTKCKDKDSAKHFLRNCEWRLEKALKYFESTMTVATKLNYTAFEHGKDGELVVNGNEDDLIVLKCTTFQSHLFYFEVGGEDRPFTVEDYRCLAKAPKDCPAAEAKKHWYTENVVELCVQQLRVDVEELNENWIYKVILLTP